MLSQLDLGDVNLSPLFSDTAYGLFGHAASLVCNRLMASWKTDLNTALSAMELLSGLAKVVVTPQNILMCKRTVKWICDFIVFQVSLPADIMCIYIFCATIMIHCRLVV